MSKQMGFIGLLVLSVVLAACSSSDSEATIAPTDIPATETVATAVITEEPTPTQEMVAPAADAGQTEEAIVEDTPDANAQAAAVDVPVDYAGGEWTRVELTNARTGATFTFADFAGKTVFVHPMATWCSVCRASQQSLNNNVIPNVDTDEVVFVSLSVETSISAGDLAAYAGNNGFGWTFSVLTVDALAALREEFGGTITNPPAAPHFIINPDGTHDGLRTGVSNADTLVSLLSGT